jgi:hypothetical protein
VALRLFVAFALVTIIFGDVHPDRSLLFHVKKKGFIACVDFVHHLMRSDKIWVNVSGFGSISQPLAIMFSSSLVFRLEIALLNRALTGELWVTGIA